MSDSYRIRTKPGVDSSIKVLIDQEFEYLEILSLKILQSQIYTRQCSDYGVIVGRISVNNGFGIPNAKVSVFIPLDSVDENDPVISDLYPYKTLTDTNEDGYRYNLLPYKQQHSGHVPTGTFFTRQDVLTNPTLIEVYDKYYKYTAVTNESGDYMIFGVPVGSQTIVVDLDLSDIGEFSLSPQDLIRMGIATDAQVSGTHFKSSSNLRELPQIININRVIEVEPLWGQPEVCNLGITRTDFDLTGEANIDITPTAIFMGSMVSSNESDYVKPNCKPTLDSGSLCSLVAGPGQILAIRQTIYHDSNGRPILETANLEQGGQVIDDNGTWLIDLPMNMDYVVTNEFGEQVLSNDPKKGIPTKAKYRFKIKWNQSNKLGGEPVRRGNFLVPNIKEYGWTSSRIDPIANTGSATLANQSAAQKSYAFSLDWDDYGDSSTPLGQQMIQEAIDCKDRFYEFQYNKVYTISQLVTQYRKGYSNWRIIAIKDILDTQCESENNKFPTNDAVFRFDLIYFLFTIMLFIFRPILYSLLITLHITAFALLLLGPIIALVVLVVGFVILILCAFINGMISILNAVPFVSIGYLDCPSVDDITEAAKKMLNLYKNFTNMKIPNLSYPDCEFCGCNDGVPADSPQDQTITNLYNSASNAGTNAILSVFELNTNYNVTNPYNTTNTMYETIMAGKPIGNGTTNNPYTGKSRAPQPVKIDGTNNDFEFTNSLTLYERLNLFNNKSKYFDNSGSNPGGGVNRMKVSFNPADGVFHYDNVMVIVTNANATFSTGDLLSFQDPQYSKDPNITGYTVLNQFGTASITGTSINNSGSPIVVNYADYSNPNSYASPVTYTSQQDPNDTGYAKFPMDIEYFQVITGMTMSDYYTNSVGTNPLSLFGRFIDNGMKFHRLHDDANNPISGVDLNELDMGAVTEYPVLKPATYFTGFTTQKIYFLVRGVDPNTTRSKCEYDLSLLFGYTSYGNKVVNYSSPGNPKFHLNYPIQPNFKNTRHNITNNTTLDSYSNNYLYYPSLHFSPELNPSNNASFSGFSSNLPSYYSNLDTLNMSYVPESGTPTLSTGFNSTTNGVAVNPSNYFSKEYDGTWGTNYSFSSNNSLGLNRGYFEGEIIEGGSGVFLNVSIDRYWYPGSTNQWVYDSFYYAPKYSTGTTVSYVASNRMVMRSDRLPTSTTTQNSNSNSFALHSNSIFSIFKFTDDGTSTNASGAANSGQTPSLTGVTADTSPGQTGNQPQIVSTVLDSFNCGSMVNLGCYKNNNGEITIDNGSCRKDPIGGGTLVENGCYVFVTTIFLSLPRDFSLLTEWTSRLAITFAACRDVWGHLFTNNWVNGTLYSFTFSNSFTSPLSQNPNAPELYCTDVIALHQQSYNFYYRSSPYSFTDMYFVGQERATPGGFSQAIFGGYGGNFKNLLYPTTVLDLGPRTDYIQELVMSDDYDGYVSNQLQPSTYSDVSELLNLFIIARLANESFLTSVLGGATVLLYFSRTKNMVDGDYAQALSVASELGVSPFESANYPDNPLGQDPIYVNGAGASEQVFGVFFSSDTQLRDYVSPKRTIIDPFVLPNNACAFSNFKVVSQEVPYYQWSIEPGNSIFGTQKNSWYTDPISSQSFFSKKYQSLDRIDSASRYFRPGSTALAEFYKGYIYTVSGNTASQITADVSFWNQNNPEGNKVLVGSPFHFYFGLKKGKSAYDRFIAKWVDTNKVII